ncbi:hypothetical protein ABEW05_001980 [Botrytis cinerea]
MSTLVPSGYAEKTLGLKKIFDLYQIVNDAIDHITLRVQSPQLRSSIAFIVEGFPFGHATSTSNETAKQDRNTQCVDYRLIQTVGTRKSILSIDWSLGTTDGKFPYRWNKCIYWFYIQALLDVPNHYANAENFRTCIIMSS